MADNDITCKVTFKLNLIISVSKSSITLIRAQTSHLILLGYQRHTRLASDPEEH